MRNLLRRIFRKSALADGPPEVLRARQLIAAIDAGGVPLDPRRITRIAEDLGLDISRRSRPEDTIERIREALRRCN